MSTENAPTSAPVERLVLRFFPMSSGYKTRCGYDVRIYATDGGISGDAMHGAVYLPALHWFPFSWTNGGRAYSDYVEHDFDLMSQTKLENDYCENDDRFETARGKAIYEIEKIIDCCRDQDGWRMKAIREAAQRIESAFID